MSAINPNFAGEMQLAGWSESHTGGCKVTFWLQSPDDLQAFRELTVRKGNTAGQRFMAALVEIGDDEQPVSPVTEKPKGGALAKLAGMWCSDPDFQNWLWVTADYTGTPTSEGCAETIRSWCDVDSRADLDNTPAAAEKFHKFFRGPYQKHLMARGVAA